MICVFGLGGQVGSALAKELKILRSPYVVCGRDQADFLNTKTVLDTLERIKPKIIVNAAAYTQVDLAEINREEALQINATTPKAIAAWCKSNNAVLIHYSTDYVFSGEGSQPWTEVDPGSPINYYGQTKLQGEEGIIETACSYFIFRTSWVYDETGNNFLNKMIALGRDRTDLSIVGDQIGSPTYAPALARVTVEFLNKILTNKLEFSKHVGVYHLCGTGFTNWYQFAEEIFKQVKRFEPLKLERLSQILTRDFKTPARRPLNSRLDQTKVQSILNLRLPEWQISLKECIETKYGNY